MKSLLLILLMISVGVIHAQDPAQPAVNLSLLHVFDGVPLPVGLYYFQYVQHFDAPSFRDARNQSIGTARMNSVLLLQQLTYSSNLHIVKGRLGASVLLPVVFLNTAGRLGTTSDAPPLTHNAGVVGDLIAGISLQWSHHKLFGRPFQDRLAVDAIFPTGSYNPTDVISPGSNFFTLEPNYTFTYFLSKKLSTSQRHHYTYNFRNPATRLRDGAMYHGNYSVEYEVVKNLRVSAVGYYLQQLQEDKSDLSSFTNSKERVVGIGPGLHLLTNVGLFFELKTVFETAVQNRPRGIRTGLRITYQLSRSPKTR